MTAILAADSLPPPWASPSEAIAIMAISGQQTRKNEARGPKRSDAKAGQWVLGTAPQPRSSFPFPCECMAGAVWGCSWSRVSALISKCYVCGLRADAEDLNSQNEAELRRQVEERQQETEHVYELLENKIQLLQEVRSAHRSTATRASGPPEPLLGQPIFWPLWSPLLLSPIRAPVS